METERTRAGRYIVVLALGAVLGSILVPPVTAHVTEKFGHLWGDHVKPRLSAEGTVNAPGNPVSWGQLKDVPAGFADGLDAAQAKTGGKRDITKSFPHVIEYGRAVESDPNASDFDVKAVYRRGVVGGCGNDLCLGATVSLYLYDDSGEPMRGGGASTGGGTMVCNPCTRALDASTRTATFSLQDLITDAGGFDREVKEGFALVTVSGPDPEGVDLVGFITNSHTSPFDLSHSFPPLHDVPTTD